MHSKHFICPFVRKGCPRYFWCFTLFAVMFVRCNPCESFSRLCQQTGEDEQVSGFVNGLLAWNAIHQRASARTISRMHANNESNGRKSSRSLCWRKYFSSISGALLLSICVHIIPFQFIAPHFLCVSCVLCARIIVLNRNLFDEVNSFRV